MDGGSGKRASGWNVSAPKCAARSPELLREGSAPAEATPHYRRERPSVMEGPPRHKPGAEYPSLKPKAPVRRRNVRIHDHRAETKRKKAALGDLQAVAPSIHQAPVQEQLILVRM